MPAVGQRVDAKVDGPMLERLTSRGRRSPTLRSVQMQRCDKRTLRPANAPGAAQGWHRGPAEQAPPPMVGWYGVVAYPGATNGVEAHRPCGTPRCPRSHRSPRLEGRAQALYTALWTNDRSTTHPNSQDYSDHKGNPESMQPQPGCWCPSWAARTPKRTQE